jgi:Protein of unknown function (DUF3500)
MKRFLFAISIAMLLVLAACKPSGKSQNTKSKEVTPASNASINLNKGGIEKIVTLANAFKTSLSEEQLKIVQLPYSKTDAAKWSNFPATFRNAKRVGLNFGSMNASQILLAKELLKEVSGSITNEGYDELQQLLNADDYLKANGGGRDYGSEQYYIAFLGTPATAGLFEIQFGGHHTAFANTYKDGVLTGGTPSFRGVEPYDIFTWEGKNNQPMNQEQATLSAMLTALTASEQATAKLNKSFGDLLAGPGRDGSFPTVPSGIQCSSLNAAQQKLVLNAIKTYTGDIDDANAAAFMKKYTNELDNTFISWSGNPSLTVRNDYVRIDGPSVWIEYSCQGGIVLRGNHPHSVWRDKIKDYGGN